MAKLGAALVCLLFAIPFGGVGVGASYVVYRMIADSHRARCSWEPRSAMLVIASPDCTP